MNQNDCYVVKCQTEFSLCSMYINSLSSHHHENVCSRKSHFTSKVLNGGMKEDYTKRGSTCFLVYWQLPGKSQEELIITKPFHFESLADGCWQNNADDADYSAGESTKGAMKLRPLFVLCNFVFLL